MTQRIPKHYKKQEKSLPGTQRAFLVLMDSTWPCQILYRLENSFNLRHSFLIHPQTFKICNCCNIFFYLIQKHTQIVSYLTPVSHIIMGPEREPRNLNTCETELIPTNTDEISLFAKLYCRANFVIFLPFDLQ